MREQRGYQEIMMQHFVAQPRHEDHHKCTRGLQNIPHGPDVEGSKTSDDGNDVIVFAFPYWDDAMSSMGIVRRSWFIT